ncbi:hypothetical protein THASP1DRAFT_21304 [Thamnocephalis sphaerospora]|uniref:Dcp1-like decapping family-domain-containing protein n=1 Tax=Thamnocephalis sphaerospora TaxID=78915 RepID=A0A4P9XXD2_9FUNG|nr:hypothetical protein THASP1DRAFT_21304 [Thamnocephalis sphaerospora]|eukprot:RKP11103.1 hypothetical protein THASP1DRAFT_21304 [Thamnocephalis sphaerospora]
MTRLVSTGQQQATGKSGRQQQQQQQQQQRALRLQAQAAGPAQQQRESTASVRDAVNLAVLRRHIPHVVRILDSASHSVLYEFEPATREWTKKGVEGAMFLFERSVGPRFGFFILNRLGLDNTLSFLDPNFMLHQTDEYIMYRADTTKSGPAPVYGIWVFDPKDRERIWDNLNRYRALSAEDIGADGRHLHPQHAANHSSAQVEGYNNLAASLTSQAQPDAATNARATIDGGWHSTPDAAQTHPMPTVPPSNGPGMSTGGLYRSDDIVDELLARSQYARHGELAANSQNGPAAQQAPPVTTGIAPFSDQAGGATPMAPLMMAASPPPQQQQHTSPAQTAPAHLMGQSPSMAASATPSQTNGLPAGPRERNLLAVLNAGLPSSHITTGSGPAHTPTASSPAMHYHPSPQLPHQPHAHTPIGTPMMLGGTPGPSVPPPFGAAPNLAGNNTTDAALVALFSRFSPAQPTPLFVQTVAHAMQNDPDFVNMFYSLYLYARPARQSSLAPPGPLPLPPQPLPPPPPPHHVQESASVLAQEPPQLQAPSIY